MKIKIKQLAFLLAILFVGLFAACEKNDQDADFGLNYIFMPQALIANLNYVAPTGNDPSNYNYTIDDSKVNIRMGVLRSGKSNLSGYSTTIAANPDTVNTLLNNRTLDPATVVLMPTTMYSLPSAVTVPDGQAGAQFFLSLDKAMVKTYAGKKLALGVMITGSSAYTVNRTINKVVVIVDVNALKL